CCVSCAVCYGLVLHCQVRRPPRSPLFPCTTLFRSRVDVTLLVQRLGSDRAPPRRQDVHRQHVGGTLRSGGAEHGQDPFDRVRGEDRKSTRLNSSHVKISYAVFCLKKKIIKNSEYSY